MTTLYPDELDTPANMPNAVQTGDIIQPAHMNTQSDALMALEAKVGTDSSTVAGSLDKRVAVLEAGGGGGGAAFSFVHDQLAPAAVWTVTHNLNGYPNVTVVDSAGMQVEGDVDYVSGNQLTVTFSSAFGGQAYLS